MRHDFFDFKYAELRQGKRTYVEFYIKDVFSGNLERKRVYIDSQKSLSNRLKLGKLLCDKINRQLENGWNPTTENKSKNQFITFVDALDFYSKYTSSFMRTRSVKDYTSRINKIKEWLVVSKNEKLLCFEFKEDQAVQLMNYLLMRCNITGRTYNNFLMFFRSMINTLIKQRYFAFNPFQAIAKLPESKKKRQAFTIEQQKLYVDYLMQYDVDFFMISQWCYYCALRPNEIVQLKVKNIDLVNQVIHVHQDIAKNKRERAPVIANVFFELVKKFYAGVNTELYICSTLMKPGENLVGASRISDRFRRIAIKLGLPLELQFYSLKDTCADRLLASGCDPRVLRDLFDHTDLHATDKYIRSRNSKHMDILKTNFPLF